MQSCGDPETEEVVCGLQFWVGGRTLASGCPPERAKGATCRTSILRKTSEVGFMRTARDHEHGKAWSC